MCCSPGPCCRPRRPGAAGLAGINRRLCRWSGTMTVYVLVLVGSLRSASVNRQLAELAAEVAPDGVHLAVYDGLAELPFYNEDIDTDEPPAPLRALRAAAAGRRRGPGGDPGVQRHHSRRAQERHRLAVPAVRVTVPCRTSRWRSSGRRWAATGECGPMTRPANRSASPGPRVLESIILSLPGPARRQAPPGGRRGGRRGAGAVASSSPGRLSTCGRFVGGPRIGSETLLVAGVL